MQTNRSGMDISPTAEEMLENTELTEPRGDERELIEVARRVRRRGGAGRLAPPSENRLLMDKLGERLAFERSGGGSIYARAMMKCEAAGARIPAKELQHIRDEEAMDFALCGAASPRRSAAIPPSRPLARTWPAWKAWA